MVRFGPKIFLITSRSRTFRLTFFFIDYQLRTWYPHCPRVQIDCRHAVPLPAKVSTLRCSESHFSSQLCTRKWPFIKAIFAHYDINKECCIVQYVLELTFVDYNYNRYLPSELAVVVVTLAVHALKDAQVLEHVSPISLFRYFFN